MAKLKVEEIQNNYEFKLLKKDIKKKYSWVKKFVIRQSDLEESISVIYVHFVIDPYEFAEENHFDLKPKIMNLYTQNQKLILLHSIVTSDFVDDSKDIVEDINNILNSTKYLKMIPENMSLSRILNNKEFFFYGVFLQPNTSSE